LKRLPVVWACGLLFATFCLAGSEKSPVPTLGFYIAGESGTDVLDTLIPELARLRFAEVSNRYISAEHFPVATFRSDRDEIQVTAGERCALITFFGAAVRPESNAKVVVRRYSAIHSALERYLATLPQPHPRLLGGEIPPAGFCPSDFGPSVQPLYLN